MTIGGESRHIVGYLRDFLFSKDQIQGPVSKLSGGERKRLQLAKILTVPCNLLVLDEPTNDLDLETLELLEDLLMAYQGSLLVVSHDRAFLDNVVTSTVVFEGKGHWAEYTGGYQDWLRQRKTLDDTAPRTSKAKVGTGDEPSRRSPARASANGETRIASPSGKRRLSYKETRELESLPERIESLEGEREKLVALMSTPEFYKSQSDDVAGVKARLEGLQKDIDDAYTRWEELEERNE